MSFGGLASKGNRLIVDPRARPALPSSMVVTVTALEDCTTALVAAPVIKPRPLGPMVWPYRF